jgi:hypothetical protein
MDRGQKSIDDGLRDTLGNDGLSCVPLTNVRWHKIDRRRREPFNEQMLEINTD